MVAIIGIAIFFIAIFFLHRKFKKDNLVARWTIAGSWFGIGMANIILIATKSSDKQQYYIVSVLAFFTIFLIGLVFNLVDRFSQKKIERAKENKKILNILIPDWADFIPGILVGSYVFFMLTLANNAHMMVLLMTFIFFFVGILVSVINRKLLEFDEKIKLLEKRFSECSKDSI